MELQEASWFRRRCKIAGGFSALLTLSLAAHAQSPPDPPTLRGSASVPAYVEYDKKVRVSEQLSPLTKWKALGGRSRVERRSAKISRSEQVRHKVCCEQNRPLAQVQG
ncbi:hypothetical protein [Tahibacter soli]|uniref:Uncharacterized protein n=1 Tax=Tahibacter soli TaxID=2983605 RepID=A0A9X3YKW8_9GAMM|nr:hypothetical protein [Tahibacter soli]MDC8014137.1 hypothetical protein [Tahibacter soli]